jgi:hypothetical protein
LDILSEIYAVFVSFTCHHIDVVLNKNQFPLSTSIISLVPFCLKIGEKIISSLRNYHERSCFYEVVRGNGVEAIKIISPSLVCPGETYKALMKLVKHS